MQKHILKSKRSFANATALAILPILLLAPSAFASPSSATFGGAGTTHVVAEVVSSGQIITMDIPTTFTVDVTPGGPGVGTIALTITLTPLGITMKADGGANDPVGTGLITVTSDSASGGGTLDNTVTGYESQFGFGVTSNDGLVSGQFQCQNTGRSASIMDVPLSGLLGAQVDVLQMTVHGTVSSFSTS